MGGSFDISWAWGIGLVSFAFGSGVGLAAGLLLCGRRQRVRELEKERDELRREFDGYREQVSSHFLTTSELVQKMTDSYKEVYEHLANGSQVLCQNPVKTPGLDFTRQPLLETADNNPSGEADEQPPDNLTDPREDSEGDTCLGDAPCVPSLDTEQPATLHTR